MRHHAPCHLFDNTPLGLYGGDPPAQVSAAQRQPADASEQPLRDNPPPPTCLNCKRPARVLTPGRPAVFCSAGCRSRWQASMEVWNRKLTKTELADGQPDLF